MGQEEFTVVLDGIELSDEQRVTLDEAIQQAVLGVLTDIDFEPLADETADAVRAVRASWEPLRRPPLMGMVAWPKGKPPRERR